MATGNAFLYNRKSLNSGNRGSKKKIKKVLFQGDSITFMGRDKNNREANSALALGRGYAFLAASGILEKYPELQLQIFNRGIGGNKVFQLAERWDTDALDLQPDVISILIGVNDHWHSIDHHKYDGDINTFQKDYKQLLTRTKDSLPNVQMIIGEPFVLIGGSKVEKEKWMPSFREYQIVTRDIARQFNAKFIPYQSIFDRAVKRGPVSYWAPDGIHPSIAGARLMAGHWIKAFHKIAK